METKHRLYNYVHEKEFDNNSTTVDGVEYFGSDRPPSFVTQTLAPLLVYEVSLSPAHLPQQPS